MQKLSEKGVEDAKGYFRVILRVIVRVVLRVIRGYSGLNEMPDK